jgi:hypothetical protein
VISIHKTIDIVPQRYRNLLFVMGRWRHVGSFINEPPVDTTEHIDETDAMNGIFGGVGASCRNEGFEETLLSSISEWDQRKDLPVLVNSFASFDSTSQEQGDNARDIVFA